MANPWAGEVSLVIDGVPYAMKLTLGVLAELESELAEDSLVSLIERFESGQVSTGDVLALLLAGLRGGGWSGDATSLGQADIGGGIMEAVAACGRLLAVTFAAPDHS